jgi:hypothetical protein
MRPRFRRIDVMPDNIPGQTIPSSRTMGFDKFKSDAEVRFAFGLGNGGKEFPPTTTIQTELSPAQQADLLVFLKSIDGTTSHLHSEGDDFRDKLRTQGTCPPPASLTTTPMTTPLTTPLATQLKTRLKAQQTTRSRVENSKEVQTHGVLQINR